MGQLFNVEQCGSFWVRQFKVLCNVQDKQFQGREVALFAQITMPISFLLRLSFLSSLLVIWWKCVRPWLQCNSISQMREEQPPVWSVDKEGKKAPGSNVSATLEEVIERGKDCWLTVCFRFSCLKNYKLHICLTLNESAQNRANVLTLWCDISKFLLFLATLSNGNVCTCRPFGWLK